MEAYVVCPYCEISFSGKYGLSRRSEPRWREERPVVILFNGNTARGLIFDMSEKGLGIKVFNGIPIKYKDTINIEMGKLSLQAMVMWLKKQAGGTRAGLKKVS
jgi:hypothetical protein